MLIEKEMTKMIIILTNKDDVTVDFIVRELRNQNKKYYRLNTEDIPDKVKICFSFRENKFWIFDLKKNIQIDLDEISSVYFRRARVSDLREIDLINDRERNYLRGELAFVLEGLYKLLENKYWLNNVYRIREAENKIYQIQIAKKVGVIVPESIITNIAQEAKFFIEKNNQDCVIKPIKSGSVSDNSGSEIIFTSSIKKKTMTDEERIAAFPIYLQENIHKQYDLRCIVVGEHVYCAQIDSQCDEEGKIDWRKSRKYLNHSIHKLPLEIERKCIEITKRLGLNYSAIDLILDKSGKYTFLECNPNGQWAWLQIRLGFPISRDIVKMLIEGDSV